MLFSELNLNPAILKAIEEKGYTEPTPIQAQAIPLVLERKDLMGLAQTGTGKTAGFVLPMLHILAGGRARARMPRALILEPTRELALQVAENLEAYGKHLKLSHALIYGGASLPDQQKQLMQGVDILIATPGRLLDLFARGGLLMTDIQVCVLDEADRMLDMGFMPDVEKILSLTPAKRQTMMFSATMPPEIQAIKNKFMRDPALVQVASTSKAADTVTQHLVILPNSKAKHAKATEILMNENVTSAFVFCNRKREIDPLAKLLKSKGLKAEPLHGDMVQSARTATLASFKAGDIHILVCSDVAARGIDVKDVSTVLNYDVPMNSEDYVHRIGRTGRAGASGVAYTLATPEDDKFLDNIEKMFGKKFAERGEGFAPAPAAEAKEPRQSNTTKKHTPNRKGEGVNPTKSSPSLRAPRKMSEAGEAKETAPKSLRTPAAGKNKTYPGERTPADHEDDDKPAGKGFGSDMPSFFKGFG